MIPGSNEARRFEQIMKEQVLKNMLNGSTFEKAKDQTFNRLLEEFPEVLNWWANYKTQEAKK